MPEKRKTLEELRAEKEQAEARLLQEQHKLNRLENRLHYYEQGERAKRTHRLCNLGGAVESLAPQVKTFSKTEIFELMESIFSLPEVQHTLHSFEHRKENTEHGTVPSDCDTD